MIGIVTMGMFGGSGSGTPEIVEVPVFGTGGGGFGSAAFPKIFVNFEADDEDLNIEVKMILISEDKQ